MTGHYDRAHKLRRDAFENIFPDGTGINVNVAARDFASFLLGRDSYWGDLMRATEENNEELMHKLELLAGPHGKTIWKAMQCLSSGK